jgi:hypothetical protein
MANAFNATAIIGKTLFAKREIPLRRIPEDNAPIIYRVSPGKSVGVVFSYIGAQPGKRENLYWMFKDDNGNIYYAPHVVGYYDIQSIKDQGAMTIQEQQQQAAEANKGVFEKISDLVFPIVGVIALAIILKK